MRDGAARRAHASGARRLARWVFNDRENGDRCKDTTVALSPFGTADQSLRDPRRRRRSGTTRVARRPRARTASGSSAPPRATASPSTGRPSSWWTSPPTARAHFAGDTLAATVEARYLFGAPMGRAAVTWSPGSDRAAPGSSRSPTPTASTSATGLVVGGERTRTGAGRRVRERHRHARRHRAPHARAPPLRRRAKGRAGQDHVRGDGHRREPADGDCASTSVLVHPAEFYLGAKPQGDELLLDGRHAAYGRAHRGAPDGDARRRASRCTASMVRREWHQVRRERDGLRRARRRVGVRHRRALRRHDRRRRRRPAASRRPAGGCTRSTLPRRGREGPRGGDQLLPLGHRARTGCRGTTSRSSRWTSIPDKTRYAVGDTATVLFASPFTDAEAWITVEREGLIEQRRLRITSGATTLKFPITEAFAPNAFVSIVVARGRSAPPGAARRSGPAHHPRRLRGAPRDAGGEAAHGRREAARAPSTAPATRRGSTCACATPRGTGRAQRSHALGGGRGRARRSPATRRPIPIDLLYRRARPRACGSPATW